MTSSTWPQLILNVSSTNADEIEGALFAAGALSVMYQDEHDQPILEPAPGEFRLWDNIRLVGLFEPGSSTESIVNRCETALGKALPAYTLENLPDRDWERSWMDDFVPMQFAPKLWVCPSHMEAPDPEAVNIWLDPGLAFGTGTHPTTSQCLSWIGQNNLKDKIVLDYGCGSGILAVAAVLSGANYAVAVDIDPQALDATRENARRNGVEHLISTGLPDQLASLWPEHLGHAPSADPQPFARSFDVVLANILCGPLVELAPEFAAVCRHDSELVLSGLLEAQVEELMLRYTQWFKFANSSQLDGWAMLAAHRCEP